VRGTDTTRSLTESGTEAARSVSLQCVPILRGTPAHPTPNGFAC
jgi:hypothetical protein